MSMLGLIWPRSRSLWQPRDFTDCRLGTLHVSLYHTSRSELPHPIYRRQWPASLQLWGVAHADAVVTFSKRTEMSLRFAGVPAGRVHRLAPILATRSATSSVDPFPFLPRPRIVFVGRISSEKGLDTLIDALAMMRAMTPTLLVVGDGPQRRAAQERAAWRGVERTVHFAGFISPNLIPAVLRNADVVAMPSTYEELGVVLWEAMVNRVPVVASSVGGIPDLVDHERTGLLVPPGRPLPLAKALERVLADAPYAKRLTDEALRRSADGGQFTIEDVLDLYRAARRPRATPLTQLFP